MKFEKLDVPVQWKEQYTKYPHGLTIFESICNWTRQVDLMVEHLNLTQEQIDKLFIDTLPENVEKVLNDWYAEGTLADLINIDLLNTKADQTEVDEISSQLADIAINVTRFGIKGDGVTDNSQTLEDLILNTTNAVLYFPPGIYYFSRPINPLKNQYYDYLGNETEDGTYSVRRGVLETIKIVGHNKNDTFFTSNGNSIFKPSVIGDKLPVNFEFENIRFVGKEKLSTPFEIINNEVNVIYIRFDDCDFNNWEYGFKYDFRDPVGSSFNTMAYFEKCNMGGNKYGAMVTGDNSTLMECFIRNNDIGGLIVGGSTINVRGGKLEYNGRDSGLEKPFQLKILTNTSALNMDGVYLEPKTSNILSDNNSDYLMLLEQNNAGYTVLSNINFNDCRFNGLQSGGLIDIVDPMTIRGLKFNDCQIFNFKLLNEKAFVYGQTGSQILGGGFKDCVVYDIKDQIDVDITNNFRFSNRTNGVGISNNTNKNTLQTPEIRTNGESIEKITGAIGSTSQIYYGMTGFTVTHETTGKYLITLYKKNEGLQTGNSMYFPVIVTPRYVNGAIRIATVEPIDDTSFRVHMQSETGNYFNAGFSFEATIVTD